MTGNIFHKNSRAEIDTAIKKILSSFIIIDQRLHIVPEFLWAC